MRPRRGVLIALVVGSPVGNGALIALVGFLPRHAARAARVAGGVLIGLVGFLRPAAAGLIALVGHGFERTHVWLLASKLLPGKLPAGKLPAGKLPTGKRTPVRPARAHGGEVRAYIGSAMYR